MDIHIPPHGVQYQSITNQTTEPTVKSKGKLIRTDTTTVEVIISDSRPATFGSQFGHAAIIVNGIAYSRAPGGYDSKRTYVEYVAAQRNIRDSIGYVLRVSREEERRIRTELKRRVEVTNGDPTRHRYSLTANSCSSNVVDVLHLVGILA